MADNDNDVFEPVDVSEPQTPRKEKDIINEALSIRRRDWIKSHLVPIYAVIGVVIVMLVAFFIYSSFQSNNPLKRFSAALSKDFGTSFQFDAAITKGGEAAMSYDGAIHIDRSKHSIEALYDADYNTYSYTGALYSDGNTAVRGARYENKWLVRDCTERTLNFFDFDKDFHGGSFDTGSFLRFTGLTSTFGATEFDKFVNLMLNRLSTDSPVATITSEKTEDGVRYDYDIRLYEVYRLIDEEGASIFYRASDYDDFSARFSANTKVLENAKCTASFVIDNAGYMTSFDMAIVAEDTEYGLSCHMLGFGETEVELPAEFLKAAGISTENE